MLNQNYHAIDTYVQPLLKRVVEAQRIGSCRRAIEIHSLKSRDGKINDCIDLKLPYADQSLKWTILFDSEFPELGPDFIFHDENFLADPDVGTLMQVVPSLVNWKYFDSNSLLTVLKELLAYYKEHQVQLLRTHGCPRLNFEYESLTQNENVKEDDVEVILLNPGTKSAEARFFIRLVIDFSRLPQRIKQHSLNDAAMLSVTFSGNDWCHVVPQLYLTKGVEEIFGNQEHLQIPPYPPSELLIDYVPKVINFLAEKVDFLIACFKKKKDFMSSLLVVLRGSVIEYDAAEFSQATVLVEKKDFHFFIHFRIPDAFPREKPEVVLQSAYHMDQSGKVITHTVTKFQWHVKMDPLQMIYSILSHIEEKEVDSFQNVCTKKNRI